MSETKTFWLIERTIDGVPHWWMRERNQYGDAMSLDRWTTDVSKARHYDCRADAEWVIGSDMPECIVTEHSMVQSNVAL